MAYAKTTWVNGQAPALDAEHLNKIENELEALDLRKGSATYTATIGTAWVEDENTGVKTQSVAIAGVTAQSTATRPKRPSRPPWATFPKVALFRRRSSSMALVRRNPSPGWRL